MRTDRHGDNLKQGTKVMANGYAGAIIRHYDGKMYEIRLERGVICTDDFIVLEPEYLVWGILPETDATP